MAVSENKQRINTTVSKNVHEWLKKESERTGASMSSICAMAIEQYMDTKEGMKMLREYEGISNVLSRFEELQKKAHEKEME